MKSIVFHKIVSKSIIVFSAVMLFSCVNDPEQIKDITKYENLPVDVADDVEVIYSDSGIVKILLTSPKMLTWEGEDPRLEMPMGIKLFFYDEQLRVTSYLEAGYAVSRENSKIMEARKNVIAVNERKEKLNTQKLVWDQRSRKISTDMFVTITTPDKIIYGDGLEADEDFNNWTILRPRGELLLKQ